MTATPMLRPRFSPLVEALPATVPFVAPEALSRRTGRPIALRLGANESRFGTSPRALIAMRAAVERSAFYGDPESFDLRARLAAQHGVSIDHVAVGAGIDDLLGLIVRCFVAPGEAVVMSRGSYPTFAYHVVGYGGALHPVAYRDDRNDLDALAEAAARSGARVVYLANPDNPSGSWIDGEAIRAFAARLPPDCLLLLDEAYIDFAPAAAALAVDAADADDPKVLRVRTFSKLYGMAGARIGYALAAPLTVAAFDKVRLQFGVNHVAQAGALAALDDRAFVAETIAAVAEGRREYAALGERIGMPTLPSATNFVAFDTGGKARACALVTLLLEHGVFTRTPTAPPLDRCVRITVGNSEERAALASIMIRLHGDGSLADLAALALPDPPLR